MDYLENLQDIEWKWFATFTSLPYRVQRIVTESKENLMKAIKEKNFNKITYIKVDEKEILNMCNRWVGRLRNACRKNKLISPSFIFIPEKNIYTNSFHAHGLIGGELEKFDKDYWANKWSDIGIGGGRAEIKNYHSSHCNYITKTKYINESIFDLNGGEIKNGKQ